MNNTWRAVHGFLFLVRHPRAFAYDATVDGLTCAAAHWNILDTISPSSGITTSCFTPVPDEPRESIRGRWRKRLAEAERIYREDPTLENRANWKRVRKVFRDLVLGGKEPPPDK